MSLRTSFICLATAGLAIIGTPAAEAAITFKSKLTIKLTAVVQVLVDDETADGSVSTTKKVTIVNKDLLDVYAEWAEVAPLPSGADLAVDMDFRSIIVDGDGDVLYDADDLDGFIDFSGQEVTESSRYRQKDDGSYNFNGTVLANYVAELFDAPGNDEQRSANLDSDTDSALMTGLLEAVIAESLNAPKRLYRYKETDKLKVSGSGIIEGEDAVVSGDVTMKYDLKDDDARVR